MMIQEFRPNAGMLALVLALSCASAGASPLDGIRETFVEASVRNYAPDDSVTARCIRYSDHGKANDVLMLQLYLSVFLPDGEIEALMDAFDAGEGCWKDIDYASGDPGRWPASLHVTRMYALAKSYRAGSDRWRGSNEISVLLHSAMRWWFDKLPLCPNWWHNDIGVPRKMTAVLLMLRDELSPEEIAGGLKVLERSAFGRTGQNKVWLAGNNLMKGLLIDDAELVRKASAYIGEEIYVTSDEGIQEDWSFHQHGAQNQMGNYGLSFAQDISFWAWVLRGSEYDFSPERKEIARNMIGNGICWCVWKGTMDTNFCGRQNFMDVGQGKGYALAITALNMAEAMPEYRDFFHNVAMGIFQPDDYANPLVGGRYFYRSDCGVWRTDEWYGSIRMHSERTIGFEFTNGENSLGNFSADGAVIIMEDGKEYENIFACWDWRKVPGVTAYEDGKPIKCDDSEEGKRNNSSAVLGSVGEDCMAASMELDRDGLHAIKTVFFFEDCVVALGCDIRASNPDFTLMTTAADQTLLKGKVTAGDNWVHHGTRGYVSLDGQGFHHTAGLQTGSWDKLDPAMRGCTDEKEVFKLWFEHPVDETGSYAYAVLPCTSARKTARTASAISRGSRKALVRVLRNDSECQALLYRGRVYAAFHHGGVFALDGEVFHPDGPGFAL